MDDHIDRLEREVARLGRSLQDLESRLALLEGQSDASVRPPATEDGTPALPQSPGRPISSGWGGLTGTLSTVGRLFVVMAGAFFLRALTEASTLTPVLGVLLGLGYALLWLGAADRAIGKGLRWNGAFHGIAAVLIAFPLVWEAATRFRLIPPPWHIWLLAAITAAGLIVACRRRFETLAWFVTLGSLATTVGLMFKLEAFVASACFLILLGLVTLWLGYHMDWRGLRWPVALCANLAVLLLTFRALQAEPRDAPAVALMIQLVLLGSYLANIAVRTILRARNVIPFEVVQVVAVFLVGFVGAVTLARDTGYGTAILGSAGLLLGVGTYAVAFAFVDREAGHGRNFYFYTSLALLFAMTGSGLLLSGAALSLAYVLLALLAKWQAWRTSSFALVLHATICIIAAGVAAGLFAYIDIAFAGAPELVGSLPGVASMVVLAGAALCFCLPLQLQADIPRVWYRIQQLLVTLVLLGGVGGTIVSLASRLWGGLPGGGVAAGTLATVQTVVLSLSALLLTWGGRSERFAEWSWLVYPILAVTGLKILLQDFSRSRPATMFLALAVYGCVLILSPRLRRGGTGPDHETS
jgi:hypothetical protein